MRTHQFPSFSLRYVPALKVLFVITWLVPAPYSSAARIYRFVDYPAYQDGYTLEGTITTTDDAPFDSILNTAEILDWQFTIVGQFPLSASRYQLADDRTEARGISISATKIELPLAMPGDVVPGRLIISEQTPVPRGAVDYRLSWFTRYDAMRGALFSYGASSRHSDFIIGRWSAEFAIPGAPWLIATAVPEPSTLRLFAVIGFALVGFRSIERTKNVPGGHTCHSAGRGP